MPSALAAYDAIDAANQALAQAGDDAAIAALRTNLITVARTYNGLTGSALLNDAGDRASANYDFWSVCARSGSFTGVRSAVFLGGPTRAGIAPGRLRTSRSISPPGCSRVRRWKTGSTDR